jgi:Tfp pilus assembly protein PilN
MKAVNLIPTDTKRSGARAAASAPRGPGAALIGLLVIALAFVTVYVLTSNTIKDRKAKIAAVQTQVTAAKAAAARLTNYVNFTKLASNRDATVRQIATQRFDWHAALSDLSKVVPANTSLQSLLGTVSPTASVNGSGGSGGGSANGTGALRASINAPAFEMSGCTATQDDVARLMSRLRLVNGVQRVTLADSHKPDGASAGAAVASASSGSASGGCPTNWPTFDLVIFFQALPGQTDATASTGTTTTTTTTTTSTTSAASTTPTANTPSNAQPVASTSGGSK